MRGLRNSRRRRALAWCGSTVALAMVLGLSAGPVQAATAATHSGRNPSTQTLQAPLIDQVRSVASRAVDVTVTPGDTAAEAISAIDVFAYVLDDSGNPVGNPVAHGTATNPDHTNPPTIRVGGLTDGVSYAFEATETTASGAVSPASPAYLGGAEAPQAPLAPTMNAVLGRDQSIVAFWNPADDMGSPLTGYTVVATPSNPADPGATVTVAGNVTDTRLTGLVNGDPYTVSVTAANAVGAGPAGASDSQTTGASASGTVTPQPAYAASAPQDVTAGPPPLNPDGSQPDPSALLVSWDAPLDDGGSAVDTYTVSASAPGQPTVSTTVPATPTQATLTGLATAVEYSITITAVQHNGMVSATSAPVTASPGPGITPGAVFLSAASIAAITQVTDTTVVFTNPPAQVTALAAGNVVVVGQNTNPLVPDGLLRQVDQITNTAGVVTLTTSQASLDQAYNRLEFSANGNDKTSGSAGNFAVKMLDPRFQASVAPQATLAGSKTFTLDLNEILKDDPKAKQKPSNASVTAKLDASLSLSTEWTAELSIGGIRDYTTYHFSATATAKAEIKGTLGVAYKAESKKTALLTVKPATTCIQVAAATLCPTLTVYSQVAVDGSISFSFTASYERTFGAEANRDSKGVQTKKDLTKDPVSSFTYNLTAAAKVTFSFPVDLEVLLYAFTGGRLVITPGIEVNADTSANPWLTVKAPLDVSVFFVVDLKLAKFDFGGSVYNTTFSLFSSSGAFPSPSVSGKKAAAIAGPRRSTADRTLITATAAPTQYTVTWPANCDPSEGVTWSMDPGSLGTVDQNGLYTPPSPLPAFDFVDVIDATTAGTATCPPVTAQAVAHFGASLPEAPTSPAISADGTTVTWNAPADGGSPIQSYVVTVTQNPSNPAAANTVLGMVPGTATSLAIPADRIPQIEWDGAKVQVTAINDRGQGPASAPSPSAPSTDPRLTMTAGGSGSVTVTPSLFNLSATDATDTTFQLSYPSVFTNPSAPASCTIDTTADTITCDAGALAAESGLSVPLFFNLGQITPGTPYTITATRTSATPYPQDPDDGVATLACVADTANNVTCH